MVPSILTGVVFGFATRAVFKFAAAAICSSFLPAAGVAAAVFVAGALAGGAAKVLTDIALGRNKREGYSKKKAFIRGALTSAVFGGLTLGVLEAFDFGGASDAVSEAVHQNTNALNEFRGVVTPPPIHNVIANVAQEKTQAVADVAQQKAEAAATVAQEKAEAAAAALQAKTEALAHLSEKLDGVVSAEQLSTMPEYAQHLAMSDNPMDTVKACKEISFHLLNDGHADAAAKTAARHLMEHGIDVAEKAGIHADNLTLQQLHADMAFMEAHGIGGAKDMTAALDHADHAGKAVHDYAGRLRAFVEKTHEAAAQHAATTTSMTVAPPVEAPTVETPVATPEATPPADAPAGEVVPPVEEAPVAPETPSYTPGLRDPRPLMV